MLTLIYDIETYPNCFTLAAEDADSPLRWCFEISEFRNDTSDLLEWIEWIKAEGGRMVGFNNVGFDYPVLHMLLGMRRGNPAILYEKAMSIIKSDDRFAGIIYPSDRHVPQVDLYRIHHFDNKARTTSLKALEFNMRMDNISDLPFPVGTRLNMEQIAMLREYNAHDVTATKQFYHQSLEQIGFREQLTRQYGRDFLNHNDTKIGAEIFQMELESAGVHCYEYGTEGRQPRQTKREKIALKDCVPEWLRFQHPEFQRVQQFFRDTVITDTRGAFVPIVAKVNGLDFIYGTGGLHASCDSEYFVANDDWMIYDVDVTSLYPSIAIEHGHYPEHLSPVFVEVYRKLRERRTSYPKGTPENAMLKLALNGVYGKSNDVFSIFYDPLFTMKITVSGQLLISLLAEWMIGYVPDLRIIQANTDGITVWMPRSSKEALDKVCKQWEDTTRLHLEYAEFRKMAIRDVNNYCAITTTGKVKRKGAYEWKKEWHQDASALVVPKVAEQVLLHDAPLVQTLHEWHDIMDFMLRIKVPRNSRLEFRIEDTIQPLENTQRYFVSKSGGQLVKIMPPLKGKTEWREFRQEAGWKVFPCNKLGSKLPRVDYDYYQQEIEKLTLGVM